MPEHDLRSTAYPKLEPEQIEVIARCPHTRRACYADGDKLFDVGDRDFKFFVVQSGAIEIVDSSGDTPKTRVVHGPGEFTGDVSHLTGGTSLVSAVARGETVVYEIASDGLRHILIQRPQLGDVILQAFIARRELLNEPGSFTGVRVIGSRYSKDTFRIRDFLARNRVPFTWLDLETEPQIEQLLARFGVTAADAPIVGCGRQMLLRNPSNRELAEALGIGRPLTETVYDLAVVGAGPAGLAAAVYGASEGLSTAVLERSAPGGQAGTSMRIENYLGFPTGITGRDLADRAVLQANKFGAILSIPTPVVRLRFDNGYPVLELDDGQSIVAKALLIATGADYQRLPVEGCARFEGCGVYYAATFNEAQLCRGTDVVVVGGGNSAGQAAVFLSAHVRKVFLVVRGDSLYKKMSSYLARRIEETENVEVRLDTCVERMLGDERHLTAVELRNVKTGEVHTFQTSALFSFIGAVPRTDWLPREIATDGRGFVHTGPALEQELHPDGDGVARRRPLLLETSHPRVLAAGDVRSGSIKRVASAVGEGAMAVQLVHEILKRR